MTDEPENLVVRMLQEMRRDMDTRFNRIEATQAEHTAALASIQDTVRLHGIRLDAAGDSFEDIGGWLKEIRGLLKDYAVAQELRKITRDLEKRVTALESQRQ